MTTKDSRETVPSRARRCLVSDRDPGERPAAAGRDLPPPEFLEAFPDLHALGSASLTDVLSLWQGLGCNRRAKALRETARLAVKEHRGRLPNPNRRSAHYRKQSPFEGSDSQVRSRILKALLQGMPLVEKEVVEQSGLDCRRVEKILAGMHREGLILRRRGRLSIP